MERAWALWMGEKLGILTVKLGIDKEGKSEIWRTNDEKVKLKAMELEESAASK